MRIFFGTYVAYVKKNQCQVFLMSLIGIYFYELINNKDSTAQIFLISEESIVFSILMHRYVLLTFTTYLFLVLNK